MTLIEVIPHLKQGMKARNPDWGWSPKAWIFVLPGFPVLQIQGSGWFEPDRHEMYTPTVSELESDKWELV